MIYIVIPVFNRLNFTLQCVQSLQDQAYRKFKIIVVDDGSTDGTSNYVKQQYPEVIVLKGDGNLWWTGATNLGVNKALELSEDEADFILTLNNDLIVKPNYLQALTEVAAKHPNALIGSVSVHIENPEKVHFAGTRWNSKTAQYRSSINKTIGYSSLVQTQEIIPTDLLPGRGVLVPIRLYKLIGSYDFNTFPQYMADEDFSLRARRNQFQLLVATRAVVLNHVGETGLNKNARGLSHLRQGLTSIKSPVNISIRWRWAKRHAGIFPPFYFMLDMSRIFKSMVIKF